ncbi:N(4)-(beta-N-acetylglucosaminyl)-L-asparaginase [Alienimonas chondri]|uniref:N(4)-(beta-N-acetylglucosaminyl)-L-asparaginase n=1 Tax=Alienimonas chondri TaxID=2681879 RepID=UPI0019D58113|nr:N(4)-(beta-N-acetylglucosaminyl)-L-asparaginase [Alienimonas chondri]
MSSSNGLTSVGQAVRDMAVGDDPLAAAIRAVGLVEQDPNDLSVGLGGLPNEDGVVELDAAVMHGPTHTAGAVAALRGVMHPARVAELVRTRTDHVLLVGEGARRFATAHGFKEEELLTDRARRIWLRWKEELSDADDWIVPPASEEEDEDVSALLRFSFEENGPRLADAAGRFRLPRPTGTIHLSAINAAGELGCTTTTSGLAFKIPGRVGDSPIIGAGLYCEAGVGSAGSTGRGEANLQNLCSFAAVELMRGGLSPSEAGLAVLKRVAATTPDRLRDDAGRPNFGLKFYLLGADGRHAGASMWGPAEFAVADDPTAPDGGARLETCVSLYDRD